MISTLPTLPKSPIRATTIPDSTQPQPTTYAGKDDWYAKYPAGTTITADELNALLAQSNAIKVKGFSDTKNMFETVPHEMLGGLGSQYGTRDYAAWADPLDPTGKGATELRWEPEWDRATFDELVKPTTGVYRGDYDTPVEYDPTLLEGWTELTHTAGDNAPTGTGNYIRPTGKYVVTPEYSKDIRGYIEESLKEDSELFGGAIDSILKPVAQIASFIPGPWQLPAQGINAMYSLNADDPLGAALGFVAPNTLGNVLGAPVGWESIVGSAAKGGLSGIKGDNVLEGAAMGGLNAYLPTQFSGMLPTDYQWLSGPLSSVATSTLTGKPITSNSLMMSALPAYMSQAPRQAETKGYK